MQKYALNSKNLKSTAEKIKDLLAGGHLRVTVNGVSCESSLSTNGLFTDVVEYHKHKDAGAMLTLHTVERSFTFTSSTGKVEIEVGVDYVEIWQPNIVGQMQHYEFKVISKI